MNCGLGRCMLGRGGRRSLAVRLGAGSRRRIGWTGSSFCETLLNSLLGILFKNLYSWAWSAYSG
jgi:hypothetical protein